MNEEIKPIKISLSETFSHWGNIINPFNGKLLKLKSNMGKFIIGKYKDQMKKLKNVVQISGADTQLYECEKNCGFKSSYDLVLKHEQTCHFCKSVEGRETCCTIVDKDCKPCSNIGDNTDNKESPKSPTYNEWLVMTEKDKQVWIQEANDRIIKDYQKAIDDYEQLELQLFKSYTKDDGKMRNFQSEGDELNFLYKLKDLLELKHKLWISIQKQFGKLDKTDKKLWKQWPVKFKNNKGYGYFTKKAPVNQLNEIEKKIYKVVEKIELLLS